MARTRIDPWLTEQPDVLWRQSALASIIPDSPFCPPNDSHNKAPKMMKVILPNPLAKSHQQPETNTWSHSLKKSSSSSIYHSSHSKPKPLKEAHISSSYLSFKKRGLISSSHLPFMKKEEHISSSHLPFQKKEEHISSFHLPFKKEEAHISSSHLPFQKNKYNSSSHLPLKKKHKSKPSKRRHRSNDEFEVAASKVLAALNMSKLNPEYQEPDEYEPEPEPKKIKLMSLPDNDRRKNMIPKVVLRDIGSLISKVCPKLSSNSKIQKSEAPSNSSPSASVKSPVYVKSPATDDSSSSMKSPVSVRSPTSVKSPLPLINLNEPPAFTLDKTRPPNTHTLSPTRTSKVVTKVLSCERGNQDLSSSEKSFAPFSKKETTFAALASAAPSFSNSPITSPSSFTWPNSSNVLPSKPVESGSSKFLSLLPSTPLQEDKTKPSVGVKSHRLRSSLKQPQVTEKVKTSPFVPSTSRLNPRLAPTSSSVPKNAFLGFAQEDGKKLKVCFHVNTNILASSLDLLDLHKHSEIPSGSPSTCPHCNVTFSSVKHCKYHQSFTSLDISLAPSRHNNIQENDLWLCPWCPLMATTIMLLNAHKSVCREKGRCHQEEKASSVRKNAPISSSQRNSPTSCTSNGKFTSPSKYKVVHGHVIKL